MMWNELMNPSSLPQKTELRHVDGSNLLAQVIVLDAWDVIKQIFGTHSWEASAQLFTDWCYNHRIHYYARPRESFSYDEALAEAFENGCPYLIVEDLS